MTNTSSEVKAHPSITIMGVGLIGGSLGLALKKRGWNGKITGLGRNLERLEAAKKLGLIDICSTNVAEAVQESQLIVVCTPVDQIVQDVLQLSGVCQKGTIITDVGSVKGSIYSAIRQFLRKDLEFVGGHPLAGSEKTGYEHATSDLFLNRCAVITPDEQTTETSLKAVIDLWQFAGSHVIQVNPMQHDEILARTSHLPHLVAFSLASILTPDLMTFCASGFKDTTRIAASDEDLWTAIFRLNRDEVLCSIEEFRSQLNRLRHAIFQEDWEDVHKLLRNAKNQRDQLNLIKLPTRVD